MENLATLQVIIVLVMSAFRTWLFWPDVKREIVGHYGIFQIGPRKNKNIYRIFLHFDILNLAIIARYAEMEKIADIFSLSQRESKTFSIF